MASYTKGSLQCGSGNDSTSSDKGTVVLSQTKLINFDAAGTTNVDSTFILPAGSQIVQMFADTLTAWDSATSAGMTIGSTAGGTEYASSVDVKSNGRESLSYTAAQLAAMDDIGTSTTVYVRVAQSGATTAGQSRVTIQYVQP